MQPTAPAIFRIALEVSSPEKALAFYSELFAAPGRMVGGGRVYFDCGSVILALVDVSERKTKLRSFPQHLYFAVADLEAFHARASALGCLSKHEVHGGRGGVIGTRPWGERSFYAEDLFGNKLCFVDQRTLFTGERPR